MLENEVVEPQTEVEVEDQVEELEAEEYEACIEALLFANGEPLSVERIAEVTGIVDEQVKDCISKVKAKYSEPGYGFELVEVGGNYQFRTRSLFAPYIRNLKSQKPKKLSPAALETLAIIAYRQPIVKSDVEKIRGVDATPTIKTLLDRKLVKIAGHQNTVGQPALYATSDDFLKLFGLASLAELPSLRDLKELEKEPGEPDLEESAPAVEQ